MSDFYKKFLLEDVRKLGTSSARQIFLGAFGKHPGWDDHVEDLGLETESLIYAKTLLYVQGIGAQIHSRTSRKMQPPPEHPALPPTRLPHPAPPSLPPPHYTSLPP